MGNSHRREKLREGIIPLSVFCRSAYGLGLSLIEQSGKPGECFCAHVTGRDEEGEECLEFRRSLFSRTAVAKTCCPAGVSMIALPLTEDGETTAVLLTDGFLEEGSPPPGEGTGSGPSGIEPPREGDLQQLSPDEVALLILFVEKSGVLLSVAGAETGSLEAEEGWIAPWREREWGYSLVGSSPGIKRIQEALPTFANSREPVLIESEPGNGRHLVATTIHRLGPWSEGPLIFESLVRLPEALHEMELFGPKGSGTGGLLGHAEGGTLFLDGVEHLSPAAQRALLAFIGNGKAAPRRKEISQRARIVASTDRNLSELVRRGRFRSDLQRRFSKLSIFIPPLRERKEDIPELVQHFLRRFSGPSDEKLLQVERETLEFLQEYSWPGNIGELEKELRQAAAYGHPIIRLSDFSPPVQHAARPPRESMRSLREAVGSLETEMISQTLSDTNWNKSQAARILGLSRLGLQKKIDRYSLDRRR